MDPQQMNLVDQQPSTLAKINLPQTSTQVVQQQSLLQPQLPQCSICKTTEKLLRCAKCKAIYYCSTDHQHLDWPTHKQQCRALAKQRQINNRLQQVTTSCGAININTHSNLNVAGSSNVSANNWSYNINPAYDNNKLQSNTFMLGTHETEILNSKAETVTQSSSTREYVGSFDANSTTSDQMHIMVQNNLDYPLSQQSSHNFVYYQQESTEQRQSCPGVSSYATSSSSAALQSQIQTLPQQSNIPLQQSYMPQQQNAAFQFSVPQLSNHSINQHEKSSSYQIGAAVVNENLWENINERRYEELCRNIINDMNQYGLSVVDDFLGEEKGLQILKEVVQMHSHGVFKDGQLVNNTKSEQALRRIRGDKITWVKGVEPDCANVGYLINQIDAVICRANSMRNNGKLGNYVIKERTKAMVACYPGSGSHYVMHVDNPNKDGRVITAIYYLNLNWNSQSNGGVLRIFPDQSKSVADIEPKFDRLIFFWSDKRNPHEVQPAHRTRYAITVWYFDANEREQALSRCKTSQTTTNLRSVNSASSSQMNTMNRNIENKTTTDSNISVDSTSPSHVPSSSTSQPSLSPSQTLSNDNVDNPAADTATNKSPSPARPTQVVRPSICQ